MATRKPKVRKPNTNRKAATADVLGRARPVKPIPRKWATHFRRLTELRTHLLQQQVLARDAIQEHPAYSSHVADAGTDHYDRDFALGILSSERDAASEVEQALDRIRNGVYGLCELTGKPIEPQRLLAVPWTRYSKAAELALERQRGTPKRKGLAPLDHGSALTETTDPEAENEDTPEPEGSSP